MTHQTRPTPPRSTKPKRAKKPPAPQTVSDRPPPESAALRDRVAVHESSFVDGHSSNDDLAEELGEGSVRAMTGQEPARVVPGDERIDRLARPFEFDFEPSDDEVTDQFHR